MLFIFIITLVSYTYYYVLALNITAIGTIAICVFINKDTTESIVGSVIITATGSVCFDQELVWYQLKPSSRTCFIGCWLDFIPEECQTSLKPDEISSIPKRLFIFRDSLNGQDFSRITRVIKQLD